MQSQKIKQNIPSIKLIINVLCKKRLMNSKWFYVMCAFLWVIRNHAWVIFVNSYTKWRCDIYVFGKRYVSDKICPPIKTSYRWNIQILLSNRFNVQDEYKILSQAVTNYGLKCWEVDHFSYLSWSDGLNNSFWCIFLSLYPSESEQEEQQPPQHLFAFTT